MKKLIKRIKLMTLTILAIILVSILALGIVLLIYSPGKPEPFLDSDGNRIEGSVSEKVFIEIGGVKQGMFIKSRNDKNPVLLYLHGGIPDYFLSGRYPTGLDEYFTVVWWEQRGSGLSSGGGIPSETITIQQMISDTKEVTNYLRNRFGQEKIYVLGRSGGSFIGIKTVAEAPELYHAYIGVGQMSDHFKSEKMAYEYILKEFKDAGNKKMVQKLEASPVTDNIPYGYLKLRDPSMHTLGIGTIHNMNSVFTGLFIPSLQCRDYTIKEKFELWRSKVRSGVHPLWDLMITTDLKEQVNKIDIPVYFLHGIYDYTVNYTLARDYYEVINAPVKGFYTFDNSAHSPFFEEPQRVKEIFISDILQGKNLLADK